MAEITMTRLLRQIQGGGVLDTGPHLVHLVLIERETFRQVGKASF